MTIQNYDILTKNGIYFRAAKWDEEHIFLWYKKESDLEVLKQLKPDDDLYFNGKFIKVKDMCEELGRFVMPRPTSLVKVVSTLEGLFEETAKLGAEEQKKPNCPRIIDLLNPIPYFDNLEFGF